MARVPGLIIQLTASPKGELLMCINDEPEGRDIDVRLIPETKLLYTLSALIPPALIPPHLANVAGLRAGGRKGRRKKGRRKKGQGTKKVSPASMLHFSVEFRLFLTN